MQRKKNTVKEERVTLVDKIIMIEKLIREKEMQLELLRNWMKQLREEGK